jgi:uncharacterized membrane protein
MKPDSSTPKRTIVKAVTWETFSTLVTFGVAWLMFGQIGTCVTFAVVTFLMKLVLFYGHERLWHQVPWGKAKSSRN